jgi:hypothetical protein
MLKWSISWINFLQSATNFWKRALETKVDCFAREGALFVLSLSAYSFLS